METFDVVVAGAGPAGAIASRHLARAGLRVLILDRLPSARPRLGETFPGAARRLLACEGLGSFLVLIPIMLWSVEAWLYGEMNARL